MVRSVLSPEKVVGRQNTNRAAAQNFISGGSVLGSSVLNSAANKIVGFQRAGVQPAPSATGSIVSTISTNINNNVTSVINKTLQGFSTDYQKRLKQVDDAKPIGILGKFLTVYKTSLGFIQFFGNKKNIDKVRDNLEALKKSFTESFEVAKLIRQVIIKIVKQLSNLPVASPSGGGGLNLDVDIPGGGLKKSAPRGLGRMMRRVGGKGRMLALGAGALGLGAAGGAAVNALSDSPTQVQAAGTSPEIPGDIGDKFSSIVDRFANAISKLFETNKQKSKQQQSSGSSSGAGEKKQKEKEDKTKPSGETGAPGAMPTVSGEGTPEQQALLKSLRFAEGTSKSYGTIFGGNSVKELEEGKLTVQETINMADTGKLPKRLGGGTVPGYGKGSKATGAYQFMPGTLEGLIKNGALKGNELFTNKVQDRAALQLAADSGVTADLLKKEGLSANVSNKLSPVWASFPTKSGTSYYGQPVKSLSSIQKVYAQSLKQPSAPQAATPQPSAPQATQAPQATPQAQAAQKPGVQVAATPQAQAAQVEAAKTAQTQVAQRAAAVSQTAQTKPQVNYLPIDMSGGGQQQTGGGGGGTSGPPPAQGNGPSVPFLPASNTDNFLVLYSRMVYNIVDG
jgi:muramidase (phage lysozyme)